MEDLRSILDKIKKKRILVVGDIFLDKFTLGRIERVNPEQPSAPLVKVSREAYTLGGAANVANNIVSLGSDCILQGVLGKDFSGRKIHQLCKKNKIDLKKTYYKQPTITKQRIMAHGQQITRIDWGELFLKKIDEKIERKILSSIKEDIKKCDLVVLSDYDKILFRKNLSREIIKIATEFKKPVLVDPKPQNIDFFKGCTAISPNKKEAEEISGIRYSKNKKILLEMGKKITEKTNSKFVIITCGGGGIFCYDLEKEDCLFIETKARKVADVVGAGDTFMAALSVGMACGLGIFNSAKFANYAAGNVVEKVGTATTTLKEVKDKILKD